jgi:endonuclease/exonuclease/phosphatase family metal-dependent hydrolase
VHYDHQGVEARRESSLLMLKKIKEIAGNVPVMFTGDLNGSHESEWYKSLEASGWLKDTYKQVAHPYANNGSFNGFGNTLQKTEIIDHIFVTAPIRAQKWGVLSDHYHGKFPSDHYPILVVVNL